MEKKLYKIEYKSWKSDEGDIYSNYYVYEKGFLWGWNKCRRFRSGYFSGGYYEDVKFKTEKEAREFVKKMREPLPVKPIIIL